MKRLFVGFIGILVVVLYILTVSFVVKADENIGISWTRSTPTVGGYSAVTYNDVYGSMYCPVDRLLINVIGLSEPVNACMIKGDDVSFATYSMYGIFVGFRNDTLMYPLEISCSTNLCTYLPQTDTMAMRRYGTNELVVYKDFSSRLVRRVNPSNLTVSYAFNYDNPSYEFKDSSGYYWPVGGMSGSSNGRFLAVEINNGGVGLLDVTNLTMKYVTNRTFLYWHGADPTIEFAVSNDGRFIAEMGRNAGIAIYEVDDSCGNPLGVHQMDAGLSPTSNSCPMSPIDYRFIDNFHEAYNPVFSSSGDSLTFYATSYSVEPHKIELRASGYGGSRLDYLAMGDSFSSGEGAESDKEYLDGTNTGYDKCHISTNSYPFIVARMQQFDMNYVKSVACSGAVMDDVVGEDSSYWGQGSRMEKYIPSLYKGDKTPLQSEAFMLFFPGRTHQSSFVSRYHPAIITLGIGGNDVGFAKKLKACLGPDTCSWAGTAEGKEMTAIEIKSIYDKLVRTYRSIHDDSPNTKIYVIGYPKLIDELGDCGGLTGYLLNSDERKFINEGVSYLNRIIKSATSTVGVKYVDVEDSLGGSALCGDKPSAMNAIRLGDDSAIIDKLQWLKLIGQESFHPNTLGHAKIASKIETTINNLDSFNYCDNSLTACPVNTPPPEPNEYWVPGIYHDYPHQKLADFILDDPSNENHKKLVLPGHSLSPSTNVTVTVASEPQTIGIYQVGANGDLDQSINLPPNLDPGYHTLHIYGASYSGEAVDLYQVISYKLPDPVTHQTLSQSQINNLDTNSADKNNETSDSQIAVSDDKVIKSDNSIDGMSTEGLGVTSDVLGAEYTIPSASNSSNILVYVIAGVGTLTILVIIGLGIKARH